VKVLKPEGVTAAACGKAHTVVWTRTGKLMAFGSNAEGQLGVGKDVEFSEKPLQVTIYTYSVIAICNHFLIDRLSVLCPTRKSWSDWPADLITTWL